MANPKEKPIFQNMAVAFGCTVDQIAHNQDEINLETKAYVGELVPGIFNKLSPQIENIYTSYPENRIVVDTITVGGEGVWRLEDKLKESGIQFSVDVKDVLNSIEFTTLEKAQEMTFVKLRIADLGFTENPEVYQIKNRATQLGLAFCPPEFGLGYRLKYKNQPLDEQIDIPMDGIKRINNNWILGSIEQEGKIYPWLDVDYVSLEKDKWNIEDEIVLAIKNPPVGRVLDIDKI